MTKDKSNAANPKGSLSEYDGAWEEITAKSLIDQQIRELEQTRVNDPAYEYKDSKLQSLRAKREVTLKEVRRRQSAPKKTRGRRPHVRNLVPAIQEAARTLYVDPGNHDVSAKTMADHPDIAKVINGEVTHLSGMTDQRYRSHYGISRRAVNTAIAEVRRGVTTKKPSS